MPNVVIVDDQATDRQILARLTRHLAADVEAVCFADPAEALDWLRDNTPDLMLVDYRMPQMNGIAFIKALAEIPSCAGIPVVVITVVEDTDLRYRALEAGATDFLNKPLDLQEAEARCRNLLTLRRQQLTIARHAERLAEARRRTSRALRTISLGNEMLVDAETDQDLLLGTCRIIADQAGYPVVRIGLWDETGRLHDVACMPRSAKRDLTALSDPAATSMADTLRHNGSPIVVNDIAAAGGERTWMEQLRAAGFLAVAMLPVRVEGPVDGVMAVFSHQTGVFDEDELELLVRSADNLGYGCAANRARRARDRAERDCRFLTHFDRLTSLPNRNRLLERIRDLAEADTGAREAAILVVNLDRFKLVNDTTGREGGDQLLLQVVRRLQSVIHADDLLARQSGDEFVLLIHTRGETGADAGPDPVDQHARAAAERVIETLRRPITVSGYDFYIGASIGISRLDQANGDLQSVLRQADTAMRHAKEAGGNNFTFYTGELTERHARRVSLEGRLHRAIENGDFVLHYQPVVELSTGRPVGVEALLRWPQEDGSLLPPDSFIPLAEETGLMEPLGQLVFTMACEQERRWQDRAGHPYMAINLSAHQLFRERLPDELAAVIEKHGVRPDRIELEVTEGAMMTDPARTERIIRALHERGVGIALDDFGIGYSSLSRFKRLPITTLKIDKDFVIGLPSDRADRAIVRSTVQLAENLRVRAVAEGVESVEHQRILESLACPLGQGFHFSPPLPASEVDELLPPESAGNDRRDSGELKSEPSST